MGPIRILVDSFADEGLPNAQMGNAREIICRLDPCRFHVTVFHLGRPDKYIACRANTKLIQLPKRRQTIRILHEFLTGRHEILFYLKASPASKWYLQLRRKWKDSRIIVGTIESRSDLHNEPTIGSDGIALWEQTVLLSDYLFSNSQAVRRNLEKEYGITSDVVPTGVDTKFFTSDFERTTNLRPRVLFTGSLRPFKQPQLLLQAAARFPLADFIIVGDGMMRDELKRRIIQEKLANVMLMGPLLGENLKTEYQKADIFLFPSSWEGSPKVILEAAASGLPVIARRNYQPETVVDSETGYLVANDEELFFRLGLLLDSAVLRRELGRAGRRHSELFDWGVITHRWEEIFLQLVSERRTECVA
ncbi:MAG TPA: glycosyltransferase family 4 protein [Terriglobales bacterium]|nr:glycosyltransferase family 4 protein [Terriglobales bacterium]